ncbi:DUF192 domain-containing protein [Pseudomonas sp. URMO17WK12:I2]|uniref:DUF192 domain-containing protein n=1 Tax=Pseudomonas sp. URMO17WK12:I2 TaxID=1261623 RepID=UPI000DB0D883|nr:DUF192 domain-containing protein [Pseudomonas sp. URMO17WK12:I2]PZW49763.1 hypothetical protein F469_00571 [Pseudomonas sp. URMO17WK12:I2]
MKPSALLCVALGLASNAALAQLPECRVGFPSGAERDLPLAATPESRTLGLSGRDEVGGGMLFAWPQEGLRELWMKDTRVALSAAFIDSAGTVRKVVDMRPFSLRRHGSDAPVRYIIEVPRGEFAALGVKDGSHVAIDCGPAGG